MHIEYFFDCSSPWTYLSFSRICKLLARYEFELKLRPILVGGIFNTLNPSVYETRDRPVAAKQRYYSKDLADWARYEGISIGSPPVFPVNSVKVMRGCFVAEEAGLAVPYIESCFRRYWSKLEDISDNRVISSILAEVGLNETRFFESINKADYKQKLRRNTDELMSRGGFGSPTFFIDQTDMYFGNDRLQLIELKLKGATS
ncbi:MAG: 2-hydroxychromene-2-carboxylate isomerase [Pseudomonadota bacterium]|nr:2-hydroxychromene-2-carboxylate isomerase [Pseudomonadota bacterium]